MTNQSIAHCFHASHSTLTKIVVDARMVGETEHGIARYVTLMAKGLHRLHQNEEPSYSLHFLVSLERFEKEGFYGFPATLAKSKFLSAKEWFEIPKLLRRLEAKVYHTPSFSSLFVPTVPTIQTLHDLNHLHFGELKEKLYYRFLLKPFVRTCSKILTVSKFSQNEISQWLQIEPQLIQIVSNAIEKPEMNSDFSSVLKKYNVKPFEYLLCISNSKPHKNLSFLAKAYSQAEVEFPLLMSVTESYGGNIKSMGSIPGADVSDLLKNARTVLFPSLYEGFGLPPVEAASLGTPVCVSNIPPHQEGLAPLNGEGVTTFSPTDLDSAVLAIKKSVEGPHKRISEAASARLFDAWSVERMALSMHQIYSEI